MLFPFTPGGPLRLTGQAPVPSAGATPVPSAGATGRAGQAEAQRTQRGMLFDLAGDVAKSKSSASHIGPAISCVGIFTLGAKMFRRA